MTVASASARMLFEISRHSRSTEVKLAMSSMRLTPADRSDSTWSDLSPTVVTKNVCKRLVRRAMAWFFPQALVPAASRFAAAYPIPKHEPPILPTTFGSLVLIDLVTR